MKYGGWNACPPPEVHVAVWRQELVSAQRGTLEFSVVDQPADREAAVKLAMEQYRYCIDIVDQGVTSVSALAAILMEAPYWYFWWD